MWDDYDLDQPETGGMWDGYDIDPGTKAPQEEAGDFVSGVKSGYENLKAAGHGASALLGGALGAEEWQASALEDYQAATARAGEHQGRVTHINQIKGFGDLLDFAQFHMGSGMVSTLPTLVGGGVGSIAAKKALTGYIEGKVADEIKKGVAEDVALKTVGASIVKKGAAAGGFAAADTQLSGLTFGNIYEETGEIERGKSLVSGAGQAALEIIPGMAVLKKMGLGKVAQEGIQEAVDGIVKATGKIAGQEALTEGGQNIIETATLKWVDENRDLLGEEGYLGVLNAMAAGAAGGAGMGAGSHVIGGGPIRGRKAEVAPPITDQNPPQNIDEAISQGNEALNQPTDLGRTLPGDLNEYPAGRITETFVPLVGDDGVTQLKPGETPAMPQRNAAQGIDGLIATANKLGFEEEAARLSVAKKLDDRAKKLATQGKTKLSDNLAARVNDIVRDVMSLPGVKQSYRENYLEGDVVGGELTTTDNPNFTMPDADIEGEALRVPPKQLTDQRGPKLLEDSAPIYMGQDKAATNQVTTPTPIAPQNATEQAEVTPEEERKIQQSLERSERAKRLKVLNTDSDSIRVAATKLGGLNKDAQEAITGGLSQNRNVPGVGFVFSKKGTGIDDMASLLHEQGYIPAAEMENLGGVPYLTEALGAELKGMGKTFAPGSKAESAAMEQQEQDAREQESFAEEAALEKIKLEREAVELELKQLESLYPEAAITAAPSKMEIEVDEYYQGLESTRAEQLPSTGAVAQTGQEAQGDYQAAGIEHTQDQAAEGLTLATETDGVTAAKPSPEATKAADDKAQIDRERDLFGLEQQNNQPKSEGKQEGLALDPAPRSKAGQAVPLNEIMVKGQTAAEAIAASEKRLNALHALKACIASA